MSSKRPMKNEMGDKAVVYKHGNIGEADDHFGIPKFEGTFLTEQWIMVL